MHVCIMDILFGTFSNVVKLYIHSVKTKTLFLFNKWDSISQIDAPFAIENTKNVSLVGRISLWIMEWYISYIKDATFKKWLIFNSTICTNYRDSLEKIWSHHLYQSLVHPTLSTTYKRQFLRSIHISTNTISPLKLDNFLKTKFHW